MKTLITNTARTGLFLLMIAAYTLLFVAVFALILHGSLDPVFAIVGTLCVLLSVGANAVVVYKGMRLL